MNSFDRLMQEIEGRVVFAWLPVEVKKGAGFFRDGWVWLRPVVRKRYIGIDAYYCERIA